MLPTLARWARTRLTNVLIIGRRLAGRDRPAPGGADADPDGAAGDHDPRAVIVLGGRSDIGLAIAGELVARGAERVVLAGRDHDRMRHHALEMGIGVRIETVDFDARAPETHVAAVEEAFARAGEVQAVILASAVLGDNESFEANPALAAGAVVTNFAGGVSASLASARALARQSQQGSLVVLSSLAMLRPRPSNYIYGSTKAGLDFFARGLADSMRGRGVHVMVARIGFVRTKMTEAMPRRPWETTPEAVARDIVTDLRQRKRVSWAPRRRPFPASLLAAVIRTAPMRLLRRL